MLTKYQIFNINPKPPSINSWLRHWTLHLNWLQVKQCRCNNNTRGLHKGDSCPAWRTWKTDDLYNIHWKRWINKFLFLAQTEEQHLLSGVLLWKDGAELFDLGVTLQMFQFQALIVVPCDKVWATWTRKQWAEVETTIVAARWSQRLLP